MSVNLVGYKLIKIEDNTVIDQWGGVWGQCPGVPNPISLPNGDQVCAPELNTDYSGYKLVDWEIDPPEIKEPTIEEKLAAVGLTKEKLKQFLGLV